METKSTPWVAWWRRPKTVELWTAWETDLEASRLDFRQAEARSALDQAAVDSSKRFSRLLAGRGAGESAGRPTAFRILRIVSVWTIHAIRCIRELHRGHSRTSIANTRARSRAHGIR